MKLKPKAGRCGFCITGNSGGATQVSYALSHYGLDGILAAVVPSGGPPHAALAKGCLGSDPVYRFLPGSAGVIDSSYGAGRRGSGPCARGGAAFASRFQQDAVDTGGSDYVHPRTRVVFLFGGRDETVGPAHGMDYLARLRSARSPRVSVKNIPGMPHAIAGSPEGLAVLRATVKE